MYQDGQVVAFRDIHPQAPVHVLVIPRMHTTALWEADELHVDLLGQAAARMQRSGRQRGRGRERLPRGHELRSGRGPERGPPALPRARGPQTGLASWLMSFDKRKRNKEQVAYGGLFFFAYCETLRRGGRRCRLILAIWPRVALLSGRKVPSE